MVPAPGQEARRRLSEPIPDDLPSAHGLGGVGGRFPRSHPPPEALALPKERDGAVLSGVLLHLAGVLHLPPAPCAPGPLLMPSPLRFPPPGAALAVALPLFPVRPGGMEEGERRPQERPGPSSSLGAVSGPCEVPRLLRAVVRGELPVPFQKAALLGTRDSSYRGAVDPGPAPQRPQCRERQQKVPEGLRAAPRPGTATLSACRRRWSGWTPEWGAGATL